MEVFAVKVHCFHKGYIYPLDEERKKVCDMIEKSNLFISAGKSRIDGFNMYVLKDYVNRLGKLQKIKKINPTVLDNLQELMDKIDDDVETIPIII